MNDGNHYPDEQKQLILLKAHKRKSWRQEHYLLYEKDYRQNNCKRIISLDEFANDKVKALKDEKADIDNILYQRYLHNALTEALDSLPVIERQIIEECFFTMMLSEKHMRNSAKSIICPKVLIITSYAEFYANYAHF